MTRARLILSVLLLSRVAVPAQAAAQVAEFENRCLLAGGTSFACAVAADNSDILGARTAILGTGASPVAGTASTLGQRIPGTPRLGITARLTAARISVPDPGAPGGELGATAFGWNADLTVGIFDGIAAWQTVGGVGSIDLLTSFGILKLPAAAGFTTRSPVTWGAGLRIGVLRESFTVPAISLSAMYRRTGALSVGDMDRDPAGARVRLDRTAIWSLRAATGKRISLFGVTGGIGYDRFSPDLTVDVAAAGGGAPLTIHGDSFTGSRMTAFGGLSWTALVYNLTAELGWQSGGSLDDGRQPASDASGGGIYVTIGGRIII